MNNIIEIIVYIIIFCLIVLTINYFYNNSTKNELNNNTSNIINNNDKQEMIGNITEYSLMSDINDRQLTLIYLATYSSLILNYDEKTLEKLDNSLSNNTLSQTILFNNILFPSLDDYKNIQRVIANNIYINIIKDNKVLNMDYDNNYNIINTYFNKLLSSINI
jgi:hypothetical protein